MMVKMLIMCCQGRGGGGAAQGPPPNQVFEKNIRVNAPIQVMQFKGQLHANLRSSFIP